MHVRDRILMLIGSWHEAFGGARGKYPQYYIAYEDLRVSLHILNSVIFAYDDMISNALVSLLASPSEAVLDNFFCL